MTVFKLSKWLSLVGGKGFLKSVDVQLGSAFGGSLPSLCIYIRCKKRLLIPGPRFEKPMAEIHKLQSIKKQLNTIPLSYGGVTVL